MIYIEKNKSNKVVLTLSEKSKLNNPFYLFVFDNNYIIEGNEILFTTPDISSYTNRYNMFIIEESITGSASGGISVPLSLITGQYTYTVYESLTQTLNINQTTGLIIETGRMIVSGNDDNIETITDSVYQ